MDPGFHAVRAPGFPAPALPPRDVQPGDTAILSTGGGWGDAIPSPSAATAAPNPASDTATGNGGCREIRFAGVPERVRLCSWSQYGAT